MKLDQMCLIAANELNIETDEELFGPVEIPVPKHIKDFAKTLQPAILRYQISLNSPFVRVLVTDELYVSVGKFSQEYDLIRPNFNHHLKNVYVNCSEANQDIMKTGALESVAAEVIIDETITDVGVDDVGKIKIFDSVNLRSTIRLGPGSKIKTSTFKIAHWVSSIPPSSNNLTISKTMGY